MKTQIFIILFLVRGILIWAQDFPGMNFDAERKLMSLAAEGNMVVHGILTAPDDTRTPIEDFRGSYLVIDFWATWCAPCLEEAPIYKQLADKYRDANIRFISISLDDDMDSWKEFIEKKDWREEQYWFGMKKEDPFMSLAYSETKMKDYSLVVIALPKYVIISPEGKILRNARLRPSEPNFEEELQKLL